MVVEEDDSSVEIIVSGKEMKSDQAEGTGTEPVPEDAELRMGGQFVGPQIVLDLGEGALIFDEEPAVEAPGEGPTVVVEEEDSSVEIVISGREMKSNQAEETGTKPIPNEALLREAGEPARAEERSGGEPDLMETDEAVLTGDVPVREVTETATGAEPVPEGVKRGAGAVPDLGLGKGDLRFEDFPGDEFDNAVSYTHLTLPTNREV